MKFYLSIAFVLCLALTGCNKANNSTPTPATEAATPSPEVQNNPSEIKPVIKLSRERIPASGWLKVYGSGFAAKKEVTSHLRRPDGSEYPEVEILTDDHGQFTHDIETLLFSVGTYRVWVVDNTSGVSSNVASFESTLDQGPSERPIP